MNGLEQRISVAEANAPKAAAAIKELGACIGRFQVDIDRAKADRADATKAAGEATNLRAKDVAAHVEMSSGHSINLAAIGDGMVGFSCWPLIAVIRANCWLTWLFVSCPVVHDVRHRVDRPLDS